LSTYTIAPEGLVRNVIRFRTQPPCRDKLAKKATNKIRTTETGQAVWIVVFMIGVVVILSTADQESLENRATLGG